MKRFTALMAAFVAAVGLLTAPASARVAEIPDQTHPGSWSTLDCPGFNPIHVGTLPSGKILAVAGSGYNRDNAALKIYKAWIFDPEAGTCPAEVPLPADVDLFCSGMASLADGKLLFYGGTKDYGEAGSSLGTANYYHGHRSTYVFDEDTMTFTSVADMGVGRWYGQGPVNRNGDPIVYSGLDENGAFTNKVQRFNASSGTWTDLPSTPTALPLYGGMVMLADGRYVYTGTYFGNRHGEMPETVNPNTGALGPDIPGLLVPDCRDQGLTLRRDNEVAVIGGGCGTSATGYVSKLDLADTTPAFVNGPYLGYAAQHLCGAVLPDRSYFVSGGSVHNVTARYEARRLGLGATAWQTLSDPTVPRQYHSTCVVTKSGRVVTMGTNYQDGTVESRIETYTPWYAQGQGLVRNHILSLSATVAPLGGTITGRNDYASVKSVTLTKLPTATHSSDPNQLTWTVPNNWTTYGYVSFTIPSNGAVTPPGLYLVSFLDWRGVPSESRVIRITGTAAQAAAAKCCCC